MVGVHSPGGYTISAYLTGVLRVILKPLPLHGLPSLYLVVQSVFRYNDNLIRKEAETEKRKVLDDADYPITTQHSH